MTDMTWLVPLPVVLPLTGAGLALALWKHGRAQRVITLIALTLTLAASLALLFQVDSGPLVVDAGGWSAPVGINLVADRLSSLMLAISSAVTLAVLVYSLAQGLADGDEETPVAIFHPTYLVLAAGVAIAFQYVLTPDRGAVGAAAAVACGVACALVCLGAATAWARRQREPALAGSP